MPIWRIVVSDAATGNATAVAWIVCSAESVDAEGVAVVVAESVDDVPPPEETFDTNDAEGGDIWVEVVSAECTWPSDSPHSASDDDARVISPQNNKRDRAANPDSWRTNPQDDQNAGEAETGRNGTNTKYSKNELWNLFRQANQV